jgi:tetratricopeptide (TPR) repeat protein
LGADDLAGLSAVDLNTKGYNLYEEKKYEESLAYFKASFEKAPEYVFPHYNYACVLSLLHRNKDEIREHLLISMSLERRYRDKYFTDPDLVWFRSQPLSDREEDAYYLLDFNNYKKGGDIEDVTRDILCSEEYWVIGDTTGAAWHLGDLCFSRNNTVLAKGRNENVSGIYEISGNMVFVILKKDVDITMYEGMGMEYYIDKRLVLMNHPEWGLTAYHLNGGKVHTFHRGSAELPEGGYGA